MFSRLFQSNRVTDGGTEKKYVSLDDKVEDRLKDSQSAAAATLMKKESSKMKKYARVGPMPTTEEPTLNTADSEGTEKLQQDVKKNVQFMNQIKNGLFRSLEMILEQATDKTKFSNKIWTGIVVAVVTYNVLLIPFRSCFLQEHDWWWQLMDIPADAILWMDIIINFFSPYEKGVELVRDRRKTALRYVNPLKGWFLWDIAASIPLNWLSIIWPQYQPIFRINRLFRLRRSMWYFARIEENLTGFKNFNPSLIRLAKFLFLILVIAHIFSCIFYLIVILEGEKSSRWTLNNSLLDDEASVLLKYFSCLYWVLVMMTGYGGTMPVTDIEVLFSMVTVFVGLSVNVTILGTVGSLVSNFDTNQTMFKEKLDAITDYVKYRGIKGQLRRRINTYYDYLWRSRKGLDETKLLEDLPDFLRIEVSLILNRDIVEKVNIFQGAEAIFINEVVMKLRPVVAMKGSYIIRIGETGREMFFISRGTVEVVIESGVVVASLGEGNSFGEVALIYDRKRNASIRAKTNCDLFVLTKTDFLEIMEAFPEEAKKIRAIAEKRFN